MDPTTGLDIRTAEGTDPPDLLLTRINANGSYAWSVTLPSSSDEPLMGVAFAHNGDILITCNFAGMVDFDPGPGTDLRTAVNERSSFLWRIAPSGDYVDTIVFGTSSVRSSRAAALAVAPDGSFYVGGQFRGATDFDPGETVDEYPSNMDTPDAFITKFASGGTYVWTRTFGGSAFDTVRRLAVDFEGNIVASGEFRGTVDFDPGPGTEIHSASVPGAIYVTKFTPDGDHIWTRTWQFLATLEVPIAVDSTGGIWMTGSYHNSFGTDMIDFDPTAGFHLHPAESFPQVYLTHLLSDGSYGGTWFFPGDAGARAHDIAIGPAGQMVITGYFHGTVDFDPGPVAQLRTSLGKEDSFILQLNPDVAFDWVRTIGDSNGDLGDAAAVGVDGAVVAAGTFRDPVDLDPGCAEHVEGEPSGFAQGYLITFDCAEPAADANGDGKVDMLDAAAFTLCFSAAGSFGEPAVCPSGCYHFDFDADDDIDAADFAAFSSALTGPAE